MTTSTKYIIQFVGFRTNLGENDFITRWMPFASAFKNSGIKTIDLYKVESNEHVDYISRNVWEDKVYFQNFPTGIAGSAGGGGIAVKQFGGYWLQPNQLEKQNQMRLGFLTNNFTAFSEKMISYLCVSDQVPFKQVLEFSEDSKLDLTADAINLKCHHLKQIQK